MFSQDPTVVGALAVQMPVLPLQAFDPAAILDSPSLRAVVAFLGTTLFGGVVILRHGGRLAPAVTASTDRPLLSVVYGLFGYLLVAFFGGYAYTQVARLGVGRPVLTVGGGVVFGLALLALGGLGYVVVGAWVTDRAGFADPWIGLVGVGLIGAVALFVLPLPLGAFAWFGIAALGVGGPVRRWVHADARDRQAAEH